MAFFQEKNLKVKEIACGQNHSLALAEKRDLQRDQSTQLYTWGDQ